jgi:hypothetical protein
LKIGTYANPQTDAVNAELLVKYYQDCTDYQIAFCPENTVGQEGPFSGTQWNGLNCVSDADYKTAIKDECQGLFRGIATAGTPFDPANFRLDANTYPTTLNTHVITTMNKMSLYAGNFAVNYGNDVMGPYAYHWSLLYTEGWEFRVSFWITLTNNG